MKLVGLTKFMMNLAALALLSLQQSFSVLAFVPSATGSSSQHQFSVQMMGGSADDTLEQLPSQSQAPPTSAASSASTISRRNLLAKTTATAFATLLFSPPVLPAHAGLLDDFGTDPSKITQAAPPPAPVTQAVATKKSESGIEPNLRSNYYYPTNKKRYLPRIKKCSDEISLVAAQLGEENWEAVSEFATKVADDTILPLKLYSSSLTGGGTNVKVSYIKTLNAAADDFEKGQKRLTKATAKKDREASTQALQVMSEALSTYRSAAGLTGDFADLPSVDDIRRASSRYQGRSYENKSSALRREDTGTAAAAAE